MSYFAWLIILLCFLSFGGAFILILLIQYGPVIVLLYLGSVVYIPYKLTHKSATTELDDRVDEDRRELALQRYLKVVRKRKEDS